MILLISRDKSTIADVSATLTNGGFPFATILPADDLLARALELAPEVIILDAPARETDKFSLCRKLSYLLSRPVLVLTENDSEEFELGAIEAGARATLSKPVDSRRLLTWTKSLSEHAALIADPTRAIKLKLLTVDAARRAAKLNGRWIQLTAAEFELLWLLASRAGKVTSRDEVCRSIRGFEYDGLDRSIDLRIARLRRKLGDSGRQPKVIQSIRGVGYMVAP